MMPRNHKVTEEQVSTLVGFMERHGDLNINAKEKKVKHLWNILVGILNQIGVGPQKTLEQWKKTWTDFKYRTKEKTLKIQEASGSGSHNTIELTELEKRVCRVVQNIQFHLDLDVDSNDDIVKTEEPQYSLENGESADPVYIEFVDHTESLSPIQKTENSLSSSPLPELKRKRRRRHSSESKTKDTHKRQSTSYNIEEENKLHHHQLLELKRLELETLRETNLHEREKDRAQIDRETLKVQQQLISFLEDIKPALIKFLNK